MIKVKADIMDKATIIAPVKKRGKNIKTWTKRFAVISGSYLYFFRESRDLEPEEDLFLKDTQITDLPDKVGEKYALELNNKFGSVMISFNTHTSKDVWKKEIHRISLELNANREESTEAKAKEIEEKHKNVEQFKLNLEVPEVKLKWLEMDKSPWLEANLGTIRACVIKPVVGFSFHLGIGSLLALNHSNIENYSVLATSQRPEQSDGNLIEIDVALSEKPENPSGDVIDVKVRVGYLMLNYFPPIIKSFITRIRLIKYEDEYDLNVTIDKHKDEVKQLQDKIMNAVKSSDDLSKSLSLHHGTGLGSSSYTCSKFPHAYILVNVALSEVECQFLHHKYATPFLKVKVGETMIDYDMYVDHDDFSGTLGGIHVYDLTNYPYTANPEMPQEFKNGKMFEILGLREANEKNTLSLACQFYQDICPLKKPKITNKVKLCVASIKYHFQLDLLMRMKDYFFDQLLDSVTATNPYEQEEKSNVEERLIRFHSKEEASKFDLKQEDAIIDLHIEAKNPCIILRARNHYTEEFSIFLGNIHVGAEMLTQKGKWTLDPEKTVRVCSFKVRVENTTFYHRKGLMGNINLLKVDCQQLLHSEFLEYIDPLSLNRALCISLDFSPINVNISKSQFTYLMK